MAKISELSDGGSLQSTDFLIAVRSGGNVKVQADGNLSLGTVTADGLTNSGSSTLAGNIFFNSTSGALRWQTDAAVEKMNLRLSGDDLKLESGNGAARALFAYYGDISFYEDTGTTAKFFWDASAESLGIGTASPSQLAHLYESTSATGAFLQVEEVGGQNAYFGVNTSGGSIQVSGANPLQIATNGTERMRIDSSGNVSISKTDSVTYSSSAIQGDLIVSRLNSANTVNQVVGLEFDVTGWSGSTTGVAGISAVQTGSNASTADLVFQTRDAGTIGERMRIDSSGNLGLGVTPSAWSGYSALQVANGFSAWSSGVANARINANTYYNGGYKYVGTGTATMYEQDGYHAWYIAGSGTAGNAISFTQAMTLDASGNLLVGTTDALPVTNNDANGIALRADGNAQFSRSGAATARFNRGTSDGEIVSFQKDGVAVGSIGVSGGPSLYMSAGDTGLQIYGAGSTDQVVPCDATGATRDNAIDLGKSTGRFKDLYLSGQWVSNAANNTVRASFQVTGTQYGYINVATTGTLYSTSSDYRLKENVVPLTNATERLKQLNPLRFSFIPDETSTIVDGFLAHEVQDIVPEAITGTKDAVDAEGNPEYQGIDQSKLVPLLVATIQELEARIAALEGAN